MPAEHACDLPAEPTVDQDDWTCPVCRRDYFVATKVVETHVPTWVPFGGGDGTFPETTTTRSLIEYYRPQIEAKG